MALPQNSSKSSKAEKIKKGEIRVNLPVLTLPVFFCFYTQKQKLISQFILCMVEYSMSSKSLQMDFGNDVQVKDEFVLIDKIIKDRGSVYSVSIGRVECRDDIAEFMQKVRGYNKKFQKATHHSYAARISKDGVVYETKNDDGETGAGNVILRILQKRKFTNTIICVTRWFGGIKLQSDRFKHVQNATVYGLNNITRH